MIIDLPMPPSANNLWGRSKQGVVYTKPHYAKWQKLCQGYCLAAGWHKTPIKGPYTAEITLDSNYHRGDLDNRVKAVLDILVKMGVTDDDSLCAKPSSRWGYAPLGCRVRIEKA